MYQIRFIFTAQSFHDCVAFSKSFLPIFLSSPLCVVGMPVFCAIDCLRPVIPIARFNENVNPFVNFMALIG